MPLSSRQSNPYSPAQFLLRSLPAQTPAGDGQVWLDVNNPESRDALMIRIIGSGSVTGEVWLRNRDSDERVFGKEILGDIYEGKRTLPLVHLLSVASPRDRDLLRDYRGRSRSQRPAAMVVRVRP